MPFLWIKFLILSAEIKLYDYEKERFTNIFRHAARCLIE